MEQDITMIEQVDSPMQYIKTRSELASPNTDWENTWRRARLKGLGSEATSFLFKLLHLLLPTEQRLARYFQTLQNFAKYALPKLLLTCATACSSVSPPMRWVTGYFLW